MKNNELFEKIVMLEEKSESLTKDSLLEAENIKMNTKKELQVLVEKLQQEKKAILSELEIEKEKEEQLIKKKHQNDFTTFSNQLSEKLNVGLEKIVKLFKEQNQL